MWGQILNKRQSAHRHLHDSYWTYGTVVFLWLRRTVELFVWRRQLERQRVERLRDQFDLDRFCGGRGEQLESGRLRLERIG